MGIMLNKCSIRNNYVKYWKLLSAKLLDFCDYVLNLPVNKGNRFNLENLNALPCLPTCFQGYLGNLNGGQIIIFGILFWSGNLFIVY